MKEKVLVLKPGKEGPILRRHHWVFSGAVASKDEVEEGDLISVYSSSHELLGQAYYSAEGSIVAHMLAFGTEKVAEVLRRNIRSAFSLRKKLFFAEKTTGFRLIHAEGDGIPGCIVDYYSGILVLQLATKGMERLKHLLVELLIEEVAPIAIWEKSHSSLREKEGLESQCGLLWGNSPATVEMLERDLRLFVDIQTGQKTGFFLDQREMRALIERLAGSQKHVLNCFAYTGGFSLFALRGGAALVDNVELSSSAIQRMEEHFSLHGFSTDRYRIFQEDVFDFLNRHTTLDYDLVILDPPAFAKRRGALSKACEGYKRLNALALKKMPSPSFLLTSSCSAYVDHSLFQTVLFQAALEAKRSVRILETHRQAWDHPFSLFHREGHSLKSALLYVE